MDRRADGPRRAGRRCPSYTPLTVIRTPGGCVVECVGCGRRGPERATSEVARAAFFDAEGTALRAGPNGPGIQGGITPRGVSSERSG